MIQKNIIEAFRSGVYGSDDFIQEIAPMNKEKIQLPKTVLPLDEALTHICHQFQVCLKDLSSDSKQKNLVDARSALALALIGRIGQQEWNLQDVATLLNKNHGSISRLASKAKLKPTISNYVQNLISSSIKSQMLKLFGEKHAILTLPVSSN